MYTIEFQKRGLPHAHILIWLSKENKINNCDDMIGIFLQSYMIMCCTLSCTKQLQHIWCMTLVEVELCILLASRTIGAANFSRNALWSQHLLMMMVFQFIKEGILGSK